MVTAQDIIESPPIKRYSEKTFKEYNLMYSDYGDPHDLLCRVAERCAKSAEWQSRDIDGKYAYIYRALKNESINEVKRQNKRRDNYPQYEDLDTLNSLRTVTIGQTWEDNSSSEPTKRDKELASTKAMYYILEKHIKAGVTRKKVFLSKSSSKVSSKDLGLLLGVTADHVNNEFSRAKSSLKKFINNENGQEIYKKVVKAFLTKE